MILELVAILTVGFFLVQWMQGGKKLPPGPIGLPVLGHLPLLGSQPHKTMMKWAEIYGPILYCRFGSLPTVVISDPKLIKQAFSMPEFAGRADIPSLVVGSCRKGIVFSEGPGNIEQRQFALRNLKDAGMGKRSMESKIQEDLLEFLEKLKEREGQPIENTRLVSPHVLNSLWSIVMTDKLDGKKLKYLAEIVQERLNKLGSVISQLAFFIPLIESVVQIFSFGTKSLLQDRIDGFKEIYSYMGQQVEERNKSRLPNEPRDVIDAYLDKQDETTDISSTLHKSHGVAGYFAGDLFLGGIETTSTTLEWMLYYMAKSPGVQDKLQNEVDTVIGTSRLPSLEDKPNMPYADAVMYEILRISSIFPFSVFHRTLSDVVLQGYHIPKNTMALPNLYAVHHDPKVWGDPEVFRPERWLCDSAKKLKGDHFMPFGTGRRSCVGEALARDQLWLYIITVFQRYNLSFDGGIVPKVEQVPGTALCPSSFKVVFNARKDH